MSDKALEIFQKMKCPDSVVSLEDAVAGKTELSDPFPIGYEIFDEVMEGGVREGELIVGTGLSGHGKTMIFSNITLNLSNAGHSSLWFSYEVILQNLYHKFSDMAKNKKLNIFVPKINTSGNTEWIQQKIEEAIEDHGIKFVFIDHIDFLNPKASKSSDQYRIALKNICKELKSIAIKCNVIIFLIAHVKKVQGRAVEMQDISDAASIYQLADYLFAVSRCVFTEERGGEQIQRFGDTGMLRLLKNRINGKDAVMDFVLNNNVIVPLTTHEVKTDKKGDTSTIPMKLEKPKDIIEDVLDIIENN